MSAGIEPKELAIEHVGNRRQRMPVPRVAVRERPSDSGQCETAGYDRIFIDVNVIVEINEFVTKRLPENEPRDCDQKKANAKNEPARCDRFGGARGPSHQFGL
jgi:hypothetical protein